MHATISLRHWDYALDALCSAWTPGATNSDDAIVRVLQLVPQNCTATEINSYIAAAMATVSDEMAPRLATALGDLAQFRWTKADLDWMRDEDELYGLLGALFPKTAFTTAYEYRTSSLIRVSPARARQLLDRVMVLLERLALKANHVRLTPPHDRPWSAILQQADTWLAVPCNMIPEATFRATRRAKEEERTRKIARSVEDQRELFREYAEADDPTS